MTAAEPLEDAPETCGGGAGRTAMEVRRSWGRRQVLGLGDKGHSPMMKCHPLKFSGSQADKDNHTSQWKDRKSILKPEASLCHELTEHPGKKNLFAYSGSRWKHFKRNRDILELVEAGGEHTLYRLQSIK